LAVGNQAKAEAEAEAKAKAVVVVVIPAYALPSFLPVLRRAMVVRFAVVMIKGSGHRAQGSSKPSSFNIVQRPRHSKLSK